MINRYCALVVVAVFISAPGASRAQSPDSSAAPNAVASADSAMRPNWFYYLEGTKLVRLDAAPIEGAASFGASGVAKNLLWGAGPKVSMTLAGATSEQRIHEAQPRFRVATERVNALAIRLGRFEAKKEKRWAEVRRDGSRDFFKKGIALDVEKIADGLYELRPSKALETGEYGFAISPYGSVTDFTIELDSGKQ